MVDDDTTCPLAFTERRVFARFVKAKLVVVAEVVVALSNVVPPRNVELAVTSSPRVVVGARYVAPTVPCTEKSRLFNQKKASEVVEKKLFCDL